MDDNQFDKLVQRLTSSPSRREAVAGLLAGALTSVALTSVAEAKRRNKKRRRGRNDRSGGGKNRNDRRRDDNQVDDEKKNRKNKRKRCRKVGRNCAKNKKCCSKFCDTNTGLCARKPDS